MLDVVTVTVDAAVVSPIFSTMGTFSHPNGEMAMPCFREGVNPRGACRLLVLRAGGAVAAVNEERPRGIALKN